MITIGGQGQNIKEVRVRRGGKLLILSEQSDPKILFAVLNELATFVVRKRKSI